MSTTKLELVVLSYNGQALESPLARVLEGASLTIGRGTANDLTLADPERLISRSQARLDIAAGGQITISNVSTGSPLFVDAAEVSPGATRALRASQQILLGRYLLSVRPIGRARTSTYSASKLHAAAPASAPVAPMQKKIPDDFDVFAAPAPRTDEVAAAQSNSLPGISDSSEALGELFHELPATDSGVLSESADELRRHAQILGGAAESADPLATFSDDMPLDNGSIQADSGAEVDSLFLIPASASAPAASSEAGPAPVPVASVASPRAAGVVMDALLGSADVADATSLLWHADARPSSAPNDAAPSHADATVDAEPRVGTPAAVSQPEGKAIGIKGKSPPAPLDDAANRPDHGAQLKAAFARGCDMPVEAIGDLTPANLEALGRITAALVNGTIRLLHGRSSVKNEMRTNVTIITTGGNNPLKFAPDGHAALLQLLGRRLPGFMEPLHAIDSAFDDLCAHQVGLLVGSRAAMYDMTARLGPERLLDDAGEARGLDAVLPSKRKARLWDLYEAGYKNMLGEAREEFEILFQHAFARAYEQEIARIEAGKAA